MPFWWRKYVCLSKFGGSIHINAKILTKNIFHFIYYIKFTNCEDFDNSKISSEKIGKPHSENFSNLLLRWTMGCFMLFFFFKNSKCGSDYVSSCQKFIHWWDEMAMKKLIIDDNEIRYNKEVSSVNRTFLPLLVPGGTKQ